MTGSARLAAQLAGTHCPWPGCEVATTDCQIDHLEPWIGGGETNAGNGYPMCGRHDRHKHLGYTARRGTDGSWIIDRPDGTQLDRSRGPLELASRAS